MISTHAPLAGRDFYHSTFFGKMLSFQPTRPLRGATVIAKHSRKSVKFQPTRPLRGATGRRSSTAASFTNFNPRAPCGARLRYRPARKRRRKEFQPTRPLRGATAIALGFAREEEDFNPRAPCGARRDTSDDNFIRVAISTHAPLAGRDIRWRARPGAGVYFNPRAPCGARQRARV